MSSLRKFATPLTIGTFLVTGVTGTLWYFHIITDLGRWLHEVVGLAMMVAVALHLILNWRAFSCYFKRPIALVIMVVFAGMLGWGYLAPQPERTGGGRPGLAAIQYLGAKDLATLAPVFDASVDDLVTRLDAAGYAGADAATTVIDLAGRDGSAMLRAFEVMAAQQGAKGMGTGQ